MRMFWRKAESPTEQAKSMAYQLLSNPYSDWTFEEFVAAGPLLLGALKHSQADFEHLNCVTVLNLAWVLMALEEELDEIAHSLQNSKNEYAQAVGLMCRYRMGQEHMPELLLERVLVGKKLGAALHDVAAMALQFIDRNVLRDFFTHVLLEKPGEYSRQWVVCAWGDELQMTELAPILRDCLHDPEFKAVYRAASTLQSLDAANFKALLTPWLTENTLPEHEKRALQNFISMP